MAVYGSSASLKGLTYIFHQRVVARNVSLANRSLIDQLCFFFFVYTVVTISLHVCCIRFISICMLFMRCYTDRVRKYIFMTCISVYNVCNVGEKLAGHIEY